MLVTRTPDKLADLAGKGADVRAGDFADPGSLAAAFTGVDRLLIVSTDVVGQRLAGQVAAIDAAKAAGVRHVGYTSVTRPSADNPAGVVPDHAATEQAMIDSGLAWTSLRNDLYAHMQAAVIQQAPGSGGTLVTNGGDGRVAYVDRDDCAAAAVAVLTQDGHEGKAYEITGPEAVSAADLAAIGAELTRQPIEVVVVDDDAYRAGLVGAGLPEVFADLLASFGTATRLGFLGEVTSAV